MSANEIAKLCENLSIKDEDGEIHQISEEVGRVGEEDVNHCLVGKILSGRRVNREAFRMVIESLWSPFGNVDIEMVSENVFLFFFNKPEDRNKVWDRGPWHFDKCLLVLEKPEGTGEISKLKFNKADFWIQIHDIPIMCMNRRTAKWLAEQIGEVIEIPTDSRDCWGKFLRVKVRIDISKPLKRWLRLGLDRSGNIVVVGLKYERLPEFCYACGWLGHGISECPDTEAKKEAMEGATLRFGPWMRAPIQRNRKISHHPSTGIPKEAASGETFYNLRGGKARRIDVFRWQNQNSTERGVDHNIQQSPKIKRKKWKRFAWEMQKQLASGLLASLLQRKLAVSIFAKKSPTALSFNPSTFPPEKPSLGCKRRVVFDNLEEVKDLKKLKQYGLFSIPVTSAKPMEQAHREP
ncbi:hypothetical protein EZV62_019557 [Acer yangbiense]|uniref:CCHC-type domain-containing protein n=1 Tax=Acer yangbiense TaxID=1000413 RepID=A0A5C7HBM7_9ROSI|nr:hypothetical protein EZV62_019557 [Acer yangbiense]